MQASNDYSLTVSWFIHLKFDHTVKKKDLQASQGSCNRPVCHKLSESALNPLRFVGDMFLLSVPLVTPGHSVESLQGSETGADDVSLWSGETEADEGLEVSQQMMESLLLGAGTQLENEECLMGISSRLQTALEKMLMAITDTTNQVQTVGTYLPLFF